MGKNLTCLGLIAVFLAGAPVQADDRRLAHPPERYERPEPSLAISELGSKRPEPRLTDSYKLYKKSENDRARLTDPAARQLHKPTYGLRPDAKTPSSKIYTQDCVGTLGARSLRNWP